MSTRKRKYKPPKRRKNFERILDGLSIGRHATADTNNAVCRSEGLALLREVYDGLDLAIIAMSDSDDA